MTRLRWETPVLVIADDFTGANDAGCGLAGAGAQVKVLFDAATEVTGQQSDVWVINTDSRAASAEVARERTMAAVKRAGRDGWIFKKIDSTLRGNPGAEIEAALLASGATAALIAPAVPKLGRTTRDGCCFIHDRLLTETEYASDPKTPVTHASVLQRIAEQSGLPIGLITLAEVAQSGLAAKIAAAIASGQRLIVLDAQSDEDLQRIMRAASQLDARPLLAGASGLSDALGALLAEEHQGGVSPEAMLAGEHQGGDPPEAMLAGEHQGGDSPEAMLAGEHQGGDSPEVMLAGEHHGEQSSDARMAGKHRGEESSDTVQTASCRNASAPTAPVLAIVGSMSEIAQRQIARLEQYSSLCLIDVDITRLFSGWPDAPAWRQQAVTALQQGQPCVIRTCQQANQRLAIAELCARYEMSRQQLGEQICAFLADLTRDILHETTPAALYLSGGDVAIAVARGLGARGFEIAGQVAGCVPYGHLCDTNENLLVLTKAGGFGDDHTLVDIFRFIEEKASE